MVSVIDIILNIVQTEGYFRTFTGSFAEFSDDVDYNLSPVFSINEREGVIDGQMDAQGFPDDKYTFTGFVGMKGDKEGFSDKFQERRNIYQLITPHWKAILIKIDQSPELVKRTLVYSYRPVLNYTDQNLTGYLYKFSFKVESEDDLCII